MQLTDTEKFHLSGEAGQGIQKYMQVIVNRAKAFGALNEILNIVELAKRADYGIVISRRSGEREDTSIADLAVALNSPKVKFGSFARTESMAKYNWLLRLKHALAKSNEPPYEISKVV